MPPTSTIRLGRSYYPSKQFASASADIDPHEWSGAMASGQMLVFGAGGIGGVWVEAENPYGGTHLIPSGYTYRNVVVLNLSDPYKDDFLHFGKSAHDVALGPRRALATPRGPCYSQGEYDQFVLHNGTLINVPLSVQWDHAGTPSSTNAGHPGHGHISMDVSEFLTSSSTVVLHPAWRRPRSITALHLYTKSGVTGSGTLSIKVGNSIVTTPTTLSLATGFTNLPLPTPVALGNSSVLQIVLSPVVQAPGTDLIVELEYEFA